MGSLIDYSNTTFGVWRILDRAGYKVYKSGYRRPSWNVVCGNCGKNFVVSSSSIARKWVIPKHCKYCNHTKVH